MKAKAIFERISQNSFLKQSFFTLFLRVSGAFLLFGFTVFLTKFFSAKTVGQYDFVRTFLLVVGSICLLGFDQSILYFKGKLASQNALEEVKVIYAKMIAMLFFTSLATLIIVLIIDKETINDYFSDPEVYSIILKASVTLFFYGISVLNTEIFRALDKLYVAELFRNIIKYVPLILGSFALFYYKKETYLVDVFLIGFVVLSIVSTFFVFVFFSKISAIKRTENFSTKEIFVKSYPIAISGMALFLLMSFDILFLKKYWNDETVAFYSVGVKIMTIVSIIIVTVNITVSAKISEHFSGQNKAELVRILKNSARAIFGITFPVILILSFFSEHILSFFGNQYIAAKQAFLILIIGQGICSAFGSASVYLNMTGRQQIFQIILLSAVILNFGLNRYLIPIYGMNGAAVAFVSSTFFWNCISAIIIYRKDKVNIILH
ncbi:oligosaccharide flippase family protein [Flavobacterium sp. FlaQc-52]|uniref:oligosaccharide flippase family protein n=1 Tax=Flavobacterium sp. FlaQc-52 TaxID=3374185 RepID=UPI0037564D37